MSRRGWSYDDAKRQARDDDPQVRERLAERPDIPP